MDIQTVFDNLMARMKANQAEVARIVQEKDELDLSDTEADVIYKKELKRLEIECNMVLDVLELR